MPTHPPNAHLVLQSNISSLSLTTIFGVYALSDHEVMCVRTAPSASASPRGNTEVVLFRNPGIASPTTPRQHNNESLKLIIIHRVSSGILGQLLIRCVPDHLHAQFQNAKPFVSTVSKITDFMSRITTTTWGTLAHLYHSRQVSQPSAATNAHNAGLWYLPGEEKDMPAYAVSPLEFRCSSLQKPPDEASSFRRQWSRQRTKANPDSTTHTAPPLNCCCYHIHHVAGTPSPTCLRSPSFALSPV